MLADIIIPSMSTTTAARTGIICIQLYTLYQTKEIKFLKIVFSIWKLIDFLWHYHPSE